MHTGFHCEDCKRKLEAAAEEAAKKAQSAFSDVTIVKKAPGRVRRFEQIKMLEREFYKLSDEDFNLARKELRDVMKKYR